MYAHWIGASLEVQASEIDDWARDGGALQGEDEDEDPDPDPDPDPDK